MAQHLAGQAAAGKWSGIQNAVGNLGGVAAPVVAGYLVQRTGHFWPAFITSSAVLTAGSATYFFLLREDGPARRPQVQDRDMEGSCPNETLFPGPISRPRSRASFICMITMQDAIVRAKEHAAELLGEREYTLEEIEQDTYKGLRVWRVTVGFPKRRTTAPELMRAIGAGLPLEYKIILVDAESGNPVAMKLAS